MKKNKGFTLIELLAVIVVLAIIALIATPIVMNTIKNSKKGAAESSANNYIKEVETAIMSNRVQTGNTISDGTYEINSDGNICLNTGCTETLDINMNGDKPVSGTIIIKNGQIDKESFMIIGNYEIVYDESSDSYAIGKITDYLFVVEDEVDASSKFLGGSITRKQIESIEFMASSEVPSDAKGSWNVSKKGTIKAWYKDGDNEGLYKVYIGQDGGVKTNADSSYLFSYLTNSTSIKLTNLDTSNVTNMYGMFAGCKALTSIEFGENFDTSK